jgi:NAD(P)-dependent dehydrogenase (short-subunit alcohol dehydrogenase family)
MLTEGLDPSCNDWLHRHDPNAQGNVSALCSLKVALDRLTRDLRTWTRKTDLEELKETDPGLAIAASVPVRRLGHPQEVANIAVM